MTKPFPLTTILSDINTPMEIDGEDHERNSYSIYYRESTEKVVTVTVEA